MVVLVQHAVRVEGHNHVNRRLDDGSVELLGIGQAGLGLLVTFYFFLEQLIGLFRKRRTHLLAHQGHAGSKVRHCHLHSRRAIVER